MEPSRQSWSSFGPPYPLARWLSVIYKVSTEYCIMSSCRMCCVSCVIGINIQVVVVVFTLNSSFYPVYIVNVTGHYSTGYLFSRRAWKKKKKRREISKTCGGIWGTGCLGYHFFVSDEVPFAAMPPQALRLVYVTIFHLFWAIVIGLRHDFPCPPNAKLPLPQYGRSSIP